MTDADADVVIRVPPATAKVVAPVPSFRMSTALWILWWRLAREHAEASRVAVENNGGLLEEVMDGAMIAIVASASALGGFAASLRKEVPGVDRKFTKGTPPEKKIFETLKT